MTDAALPPAPGNPLSQASADQPSGPQAAADQPSSPQPGAGPAPAPQAPAGRPPAPPAPPAPGHPPYPQPGVFQPYPQPAGPGPWAAPPSYGMPLTDPWLARPATTLPPSRFAVAMSQFWERAADHAPRGVLLGAAAVGAAAGVLAVGQRPGLGAALVGAVVWLPGVPALVRRRAVVPLILVAAAVALVGVTAVRDAPWLLVLCVLGSVGVGVAAVTDARTVPALAAVPLSAAAGFVRALPWAARGTVATFGGRRKQAIGLAKSVAVTVVLLGVFGALLASADGVFAGYLDGIDVDRGPARVFWTVVMASAAAAAAHLAIAPPGWGTLEAPRPRAARLAEWLLPVGALTALVLGFIGLQVSALLGGHRHVLESAGLTYAEYARQGFGQLMAVTVGTLLVVAVAARRAPRTTRTERLATSAVLAALCVGTLGVVASALRRMDLYVEAFGLTRLRVFVVAVEIALGVVLLLVLVAGVRWRGAWLPRAVVGVAAVTLLGLAAVNPDALVLRHNAEGALSGSLTEGLDVDYLRGLSADAVPDAAALPEPLRSCLLDGRSVPQAADVAGWNLGRERAIDALDGLEIREHPCADLP